MFLGVDESFNGDYTTLGCIAIPLNLLPDYEKDYISTRLKEKVWAEVKWSKLTESYLGKYKVILKNYLSQKDVTFHSWTYKKPTREELNRFYSGDKDKVIYRQAYLLLRNVIRKVSNSGNEEPFYIVADETGPLGLEEYKITRDLLVGDKYINPHPKLEFCSQGNSQICGALQICDVLTGATQFLYDSKKVVDDYTANELICFLKEINKGVPINNSCPAFPRLDDFKIHHCLVKYKPKDIK